MNDAGTLGVFALAAILLAVIGMSMDKNTAALIGACLLFYLACRHSMRDGDDKNTSDSFDDNSATQEPEPTQPPTDHEPNVLPVSVGSADANVLWKNQRPPDPVHAQTDRERIAQSNAATVRELYGRRTAGSIDNALYVHKQRIGDRDRQATINQVRGRRGNVYEPYYRQELSDHASKRWWEPESVLAMKLDKRQLNTLDMNQFADNEYDLDGVYTD